MNQALWREVNHGNALKIKHGRQTKNPSPIKEMGLFERTRND
jgi:hypothetical protein